MEHVTFNSKKREKEREGWIEKKKKKKKTFKHQCTVHSCSTLSSWQRRPSWDCRRNRSLLHSRNPPQAALLQQQQKQSNPNGLVLNRVPTLRREYELVVRGGTEVVVVCLSTITATGRMNSVVAAWHKGDRERKQKTNKRTQKLNRVALEP